MSQLVVRREVEFNTKLSSLKIIVENTYISLKHDNKLQMSL
jgi:hypothetical protein